MNKKQKSKVFKFRKIRLSKKSQAYNILEYYLVRIPFILVLVALFVYMASSI